MLIDTSSIDNNNHLELLQELKAPSVFNLYNTRDNSILLPKKDYGVLLLVDRAVNGLSSLTRLNVGKQIKYLYLPKQIKVYNKKFSINRNNFNDDINRLRLNVVQIPAMLTQSFIVDITPFVSFLFSRFNIYKYNEECIKFIDSTIGSLISGMKPGAIKKWILLYVIDDSYIGEASIIDKHLYGYALIRAFMLNNKQTGVLGSNLDDVFMCHVSNRGANEVRKIYNKEIPVDYSRMRNLIVRIKPQIFTSDEQSSEDTSDDTADDKKDKVTSNTNTQQSQQQEIQPVPTTTDADTSTIAAPSTSPLERIDRSDLQGLINYANYDTDEHLQRSVAIITKINDDQYKEDREIPIDDTSVKDDQDNPVVNINNNVMFPFLNSTKEKDNNVSDVKSASIQIDKDNDIKVMLDSICPIITKNPQQEKTVYNQLYSKISRDPKLINNALKLFKDKNFKELMIYINNFHQDYHSKIYPVKKEVDRTVLKELDDWSIDNGYIDPVPSDPVLTSDIIGSTVESNIHRVMAQKQLTWNTMPQQVEKYISKLLDDNGFQLISVTMVDKDPPITQIEPTYKSEIRIKVRNTKNKKSQTLVFEVPTLMEGKYHISGGIKWLFPNVIATLPIFVIHPGKVQFRSSYASITYQHHTTSTRQNISVYVGGINMPLLVWLLQYKSFNDIAKDLGISYKAFESRKDIPDSMPIRILLSDKKTYLGAMITNSSNAKLIRGLMYDLQMLMNKLSNYNEVFDFYMYDKGSEYIQFYANKKNVNYMFDKIKRYTIDKRTEEILVARGIDPDMYTVALKCADLCINDVTEERLGIDNVNIRLMDLIPSQIEKLSLIPV